MRASLAALLLIFLFECSSPSINPESDLIQEPEETPVGPQHMFDFDEVDHYFADMTEEQIWAVEEKRHESADNDLFVDLMFERVPTDLSDTSFIQKMAAIGYVKTEVHDSLLNPIHALFKDELDPIGGGECINLYRDLLIFRKSGFITGMAKICFGCEAMQLQGYKRRPDYGFPMPAFKELKVLLHPEDH